MLDNSKSWDRKNSASSLNPKEKRLNPYFMITMMGIIRIFEYPMERSFFALLQIPKQVRY